MEFILRDDFFLQLLADYLLFSEMLMGQAAEICLQKLGQKLGLSIEEYYFQNTGRHD